ncbi:hypothetical protein, partial [Streptococcus thoraltensis]
KLNSSFIRKINIALTAQSALFSTTQAQCISKVEAFCGHSLINTIATLKLNSSFIRKINIALTAQSALFSTTQKQCIS